MCEQEFLQPSFTSYLLSERNGDHDACASAQSHSGSETAISDDVLNELITGRAGVHRGLRWEDARGIRSGIRARALDLHVAGTIAVDACMHAGRAPGAAQPVNAVTAPIRSSLRGPERGRNSVKRRGGMRRERQTQSNEDRYKRFRGIPRRTEFDSDILTLNQASKASSCHSRRINNCPMSNWSRATQLSIRVIRAYSGRFSSPTGRVRLEI